VKALILAAGYATRLYPLTLDRPKPLLQIGEKTILDHFLSRLAGLNIDGVYVVTNSKFTGSFKKWADAVNGEGRYTDFTIEIINDGTMDNESRLGAIGDIHFSIQQKAIKDDLMVSAGDNVYNFDFIHFLNFYTLKKSDVILAHPVFDREKLKRHGVVQVDADQHVMGFFEKSAQPPSHLVSPAFYIFKKSTLTMFGDYLAQNNNPDAPGHFISWLYTRQPVYAYIMEETYYDIGTLEAYHQVCDEWK
jgi:glucose-1-phosphate thymidylyltransferase